MSTQWHPLFAHLLRPLVEGHYEVKTNLTVGDAPREADLVLLRRTSVSASPFQGLWRHLTTWNLLEFKGPTVSARVADLDLLIELGLGIDRRLNEERHKKEEPHVERAEVTYWYLANHLGSRFLRDAQDLLGELPAVGPGVWRTRYLGRWLILVSNREVPVERDSIPLHLLVQEPLDATRAAAREVATQPDLWQLYSNWLATFFPDLWQEVRQMAKESESGPVIDLRRVVEVLGLEEFIEQVGSKRIIDTLGVDGIAARLSPEQQREMLQRLQARLSGEGDRGKPNGDKK
jgi:hypothetical protein